jgi:hypothetical protein
MDASTEPFRSAEAASTAEGGIAMSRYTSKFVTAGLAVALGILTVPFIGSTEAQAQVDRKRCLWALCFGLDAQDGLAGFQAQGISSSRRLLGQLLTSLVSTSLSQD